MEAVEPTPALCMPPWAEAFPRLFEIYTASNRASPDNWFQQPNVWRGLLDNSAVLQPLEAETAGDVKPDIKPLVGSSSLFPRDRIVYHGAPGRYVSLALVKAPTFAVFGTLVDWRSSLIREGEALGRARGLGC